MKIYFENHGFKVVNTKSACSKTTTLGKAKLPMNLPYDLAKEALLETPEAEGFILHVAFGEVLPFIQCLESEFGKPVIIDDVNYIWAGLKSSKHTVPNEGSRKNF